MSIRKKIAVVLLTIIFLAFYGGNTMFYHVHYIDNVAYVHSHPFASTNHAHSTSVIHSIDQINGGLAFLKSSTELEQFIPKAIAIFYLKKIVNKLGRTYNHSSLRAPPAMIL